MSIADALSDSEPLADRSNQHSNVSDRPLESLKPPRMVGSYRFSRPGVRRRRGPGGGVVGPFGRPGFTSRRAVCSVHPIVAPSVSHLRIILPDYTSARSALSAVMIYGTRIDNQLFDCGLIALGLEQSVCEESL